MKPAIDPNSLGNLVVDLGYCTDIQVKAGLARMGKSLKLGEALIELGFITQHQLDWALTHQGVERGQADEDDVHKFVKQQHDGIVDDLREVTEDVRELTDRLNAKDPTGS